MAPYMWVSTCGLFSYVFLFCHRIAWQMDQSGNSLKHIKCSKEYLQVTKSLDALQSLFGNTKLLAEFELLRRMTPKIAVRLRNSPYSRSLEQLLRTVTIFKKEQFHLKISELKQFFQSDISKIDNVKPRIWDFIVKTEAFGQLVSKMIFHSNKAYKLAQLWLDLGQLINHFLVVCGVTSRICVIAKAILVYVYDIYMIELKLVNFCGCNRPDELQSCLLKHAIKLRSSNSNSRVNNSIKEEFLVLQTNKQLPNNYNDGLRASSDCVSSLQCDTDEQADLGVPLNREKFMQTVMEGHSNDKKSRKRTKKQAAVKKKRVLQCLTSEVVQRQHTTAVKRKKEKRKSVNQFQIELIE